jgi:hypothetical protein
MLGEEVLNCLDAAPRPVFDPGLGKIVLDQMEHAAPVHVGQMIGAGYGCVMSRSAHLFGP